MAAQGVEQRFHGALAAVPHGQVHHLAAGKMLFGDGVQQFDGLERGEGTFKGIRCEENFHGHTSPFVLLYNIFSGIILNFLP